MQTLEGLKRKIVTVNDLLSVVKTMKSLAALNIRTYENAVESLGHYERVVSLGWRSLIPGRISLPRVRATGPCVLFVVGSDQGMCGQFNEAVAEQARRTAEEQRARGRAVLVWTSGERVRASLEDQGLAPALHFPLPGSLPGITEQIGALLQAYATVHQKGQSIRFHLAHNQLRGQSSYEPASLQLFPFDKTWREQLGGQGWPGRSIPLPGPGVQRLFRDLLEQYLFILLYRAFALSMAAENAARLAAMQAAEKNIQELDESLQSNYRQTRQNAITEELIDIVSGFVALEDDEEEKDEEEGKGMPPAAREPF